MCCSKCARPPAKTRQPKIYELRTSFRPPPYLFLMRFASSTSRYELCSAMKNLMVAREKWTWRIAAKIIYIFNYRRWKRLKVANDEVVAMELFLEDQGFKLWSGLFLPQQLCTFKVNKLSSLLQHILFWLWGTTLKDIILPKFLLSLLFCVTG
jgi:hypothetical protein